MATGTSGSSLDSQLRSFRSRSGCSPLMRSASLRCTSSSGSFSGFRRRCFPSPPYRRSLAALGYGQRPSDGQSCRCRRSRSTIRAGRRSSSRTRMPRLSTIRPGRDCSPSVTDSSRSPSPCSTMTSSLRALRCSKSPAADGAVVGCRCLSPTTARPFLVAASPSSLQKHSISCAAQADVARLELQRAD